MSLLKEIGYAAGMALAAFVIGFFAWPLTHHKPAAETVPVAQAKAIQAQDARGALISQDAAVKATQAVADIHAAHAAIRERIKAYVPQTFSLKPVPQADPDSGSFVTAGFVSVWNASASGDQASLSASAGSAAAQPSAVSPADILTAHDADIEYCDSELTKYHQLWDWSQQQARLAEEGTK